MTITDDYDFGTTTTFIDSIINNSNENLLSPEYLYNDNLKANLT